MATPLEVSDGSQNKLKRVRYTHDAMIDVLLQKPNIAQGELALLFGYTDTWVSQIMNSDAFQARLATRKTELVDPEIKEELNNRMERLASLSMAVIEKKLVATQNPDLAIKTLELTNKALGFGARPETNTTINQSYVVVMPQKAESAVAWAANAKDAIDVEAKAVTG